MTTMNNRLTAEELKKLRQTDFGKKPGFETAETMLTREVGKAGSPERDEFNAKALAWYYGEVLCDRRSAGHHAPARREPYLRQSLPRFLLCTAYQGRNSSGG